MLIYLKSRLNLMRTKKDKYTVYGALHKPMKALFELASSAYITESLMKKKYKYCEIKRYNVNIFSSADESDRIFVSAVLDNNPTTYCHLDNDDITCRLVKDLHQYCKRKKQGETNTYQKHIDHVLAEYNRQLHYKLNLIRLSWLRHKAELEFEDMTSNERITKLTQILMPIWFDTIASDPQHVMLCLDNDNITYLKDLVENKTWQTLVNNKDYIAHCLMHYKRSD